MACDVTRENIQESITRTINQMAQTMTPQEINNAFGENVLSEDGNEITISNDLIDRYEDHYETVQGTEEGRQAFLQLSESVLPKSSPLTLRKVKIMLERMGVNYQIVKDLVVNGKKLDANGVALPLQSLVQVAEGHEETALPEEAYHIGIEILEQTNKGLVNQMLSKVTSLPIWQEVYEQYKDVYKGNLRKIKKEAIAKQLVLQTQESEANPWWKKALTFLRNLFRTSEVNINPFQDALNILTNQNIGTVRNTLLNNQIYLQEQGINTESANTIIQLANSDISDTALQEAISQLLPENAFLQVAGVNVNSTYNKLQEPKNSTTAEDITKRAESTLKQQYGSTTRFTEAWDELTNQENRDGHRDVADILNRYIDQEGYARENPLSTHNENSNKYSEIEDIVADRIASFPNDTRFLVNTTVTNGEQKANVDLIAVTNNGVVSFYNFIASDEERITNIKKQIYSDQAQAIKDILRSGYGIRKFGQARYTPLAMSEDPVNEESYIDIVPVTERTPVKSVNTLLDALNSRINALRTAKAKRERASLQISSSSIIGAINDLLVTGTFTKIVNLTERAIQDAENLLKNSSQRNSSFFTRLSLIQDNLTALKDINSTIIDASEAEGTIFEDKRKGLSKAEKLNSQASKLLTKLQHLQDEINNENAENQGVRNILEPEATVSTVTKWFRKLSQAQTKATQYLYKLLSTLDAQINTQLLSRMPALADLRTEVTNWAKSKGIKEQDIIKQILKKDKFELIDQYDKDTFVTGLVQAQTQRDENWINENVNIRAFYQWRSKEREEFVNTLDQRISQDTLTEEGKEEQLKRFDEIFDIFSENNIKIRQFITDKFLSEDYKRIQQEVPLFKLYQYIRNLNNEAEEAGAIQDWQAKVVVPMIRKDLMEKFVFGGKIQFGSEFFKSLVGTDETFQYGQRDAQTGEIIDSIPFYYMADISTKNDDGTRDYSNISTDIFKVLAIYQKQVLKYSAYSKIEDEVSLMLRGEKAKSSLPTTRFGDVRQGEAAIPNNEVNAQYFENFQRAKIYGQKNIGAKWDTKLVQISTKAAKAFNNLVGREVINTDFDKQYVSLTGAVDATNRFFQMKVLGLNPVVSIANFFGGNMQAYIENGRYFTKNEFAAAEWEYVSNLKDKKTAALLDYFDFLYDGERVLEKANQMSFNQLTQTSIQEKLFAFQRWSEKPIQGAFAIALSRNTIIENGELVNIREYLKNTPKYQGLYDLKSESERNALQQEYEQDVKKLQQRSIYNLAEFQDGILTIPGVERTSEAVAKHIAFTQQLTRQSTGGGNRDDIRQINLTLLGRSAMVFKSWLPGILLNRFQGLTYNVGRDTYEMGRVTALAQNLSLNVVKSFQDLYGIISGNNRGIELLKDRYQTEKEKYLNRTGQEEFDFSERDFIDMYRAAIKNTMLDAMMLSAIAGIIFAVGAAQPPEDEEVKLGSWKWTLRSLNKIEDELSFFYSPSKLIDVANGGLMPSLGVLKDGIKLFSHTARELGAQITDNPEAAEKAKPTKYMLKAFPVLKQLDQFFVVLMPELAQEYGLDIQTQDFSR